LASSLHCWAKAFHIFGALVCGLHNAEKFGAAPQDRNPPVAQLSGRGFLLGGWHIADISDDGGKNRGAQSASHFPKEKAPDLGPGPGNE
jgi:hypothetical protein